MQFAVCSVTHMVNFSIFHTAKSKLYWGVLLVWICFMVRGLFYTVMVPMWEGFDEYVHFAYIQQIVHAGGLPVSSDPISKELEESLKLVPTPWELQNTDPSLTSHDRYWNLTKEERERREAGLLGMPRSWSVQKSEGARKIYEAQQPPLYYWLMSVPLRAASGLTLPARAFLIRLLSLLLASLAIPAGFLLSKKIWRNEPFALGITALISIMPGLMTDICRVCNDSLALLLYTVMVYAALLFFEKPRLRTRGLLLACSLGMGLITKAYFLTAVPALAVLVLINLRRQKGQNLLVRGGVVFVVAGMISAWWYMRNHMLTGTWSGLMQDVSLKNISFVDLFRKIPEVDWVNAFKSTLLSHIWFGNWSFLQVRSWMYRVYQYMGALALIGFLIYWVRSFFRRLPQTLPSPGSVLILFSFYGFFCLGISYHVLMTFMANNSSSSAGWYFYALIFPQTLLIMVGLAILLPSKIHKYLIPAATLSFGLLDIYTVHFISIPYYVGLIQHKANGSLETFYLSRIQDIGIWKIFTRMSWDEPFSGPLAAMMIWICYLVATGILFVISLRIMRRQNLESLDTQ